MGFCDTLASMKLSSGAEVARFDDAEGDTGVEVRRFDLASFSPRTRFDARGFLVADAYFTRAGIFEYQRADGSRIRELRPEEEVFHADSLATLAGAPVTREHPTNENGQRIYITPDNVKQFQVGVTGHEVNRDDTKVAGNMTIQDAGVIQDVQSGKLKEISMGYKCRIEMTGGTHPKFGRYDAIQRHIRYNHTALGGTNWGRAGEEIGLRLDSNDAIQVQPEPGADRADSRSKAMETITINGVEYEVPKAAAQAYRTVQQRTDSQVEKLTKDNEALQGRLDAKGEEVKKLEEKLQAAEDPKRFDSAVSERIDLLTQARTVLGEKAEIQGTSRQIMEQVLKHDSKDADFSGRSDDYIQGRFDDFMSSFSKQRQDKKDSMSRARGAVDSPGDNKTADKFDSSSARERMLERNRQMAASPLTVSKEQPQA